MAGQNIKHSVSGLVTTTDATVTTLASFTLANNGCYSINVELIGKDTISGKSIKGVKGTTFERISGTTTQVATSLVDIIVTLISDAVNNAGATWTINNSGDVIQVRVTGNVGRTIDWQCRLDIQMN